MLFGCKFMGLADANATHISHAGYRLSQADSLSIRHSKAAAQLCPFLLCCTRSCCLTLVQQIIEEERLQRQTCLEQLLPGSSGHESCYYFWPQGRG